MTELSKPRICVVGSCNMDLISYIPRMPAPGETLHGDRFDTGFGGKGANQAVMAARLGVEVSMVGKVGTDGFGRDTLDNFREQGVDVRHVLQTSEASTGVAPILVDESGQNSIIVVGGANQLLTAADVEAAREVIADAAVLVCQMEVPLAANLQALKIAREEGVLTLFNSAPASELPAELYPLCDLFCPNESEAALLTGLPVESDEQAEAAVAELLARGCGSVLMTLGSRGAMLVTPEGTERFTADKVKAVDSTGAGDCFVGSLAGLIARGVEVKDAIPMACQIATLSVMKEGTQRSYPDAEGLASILG